MNELHYLDMYMEGFDGMDGRFKNDGIPEIVDAVKEV